jgi:ribonuclease HII
VFDAGVDEVGRGALAGAVMAGAVILGPALIDVSFQDSKKISAKKREDACRLIMNHAYAWGIGTANVREIEAFGIHHATLLAMKRAVHALNRSPQKVWVDGMFAPELPWPTETMIKGDQKVSAIAAASILAKVLRDALMDRYEDCYPGYGLQQHKGYGTRAHFEAIEANGPSLIHRRTFSPIDRWDV